MNLLFAIIGALWAIVLEVVVLIVVLEILAIRHNRRKLVDRDNPPTSTLDVVCDGFLA